MRADIHEQCSVHVVPRYRSQHALITIHFRAPTEPAHHNPHREVPWHQRRSAQSNHHDCRITREEMLSFVFHNQLLLNRIESKNPVGHCDLTFDHPHHGGTDPVAHEDGNSRDRGSSPCRAAPVKANGGSEQQ
jgi:hypothetical protein